MIISDTNKLFLYANLTLNQQMVLKGHFRHQAKHYFNEWNKKCLQMYKEIMRTADQQTENGADFIENLTCTYSEISDLILRTNTDKWESIKEYIKNLNK